MAKQKKQLKIADWVALDWEEQEPEVPENEVMGKCHFCKGNIKITEHYFYGSTPTESIEPGQVLFQACTRCVESAGIKW